MTHESHDYLEAERKAFTDWKHGVTPRPWMRHGRYVVTGNPAGPMDAEEMRSAYGTPGVNFGDATR